jgi:hypothetical protein
MNEIVKIDAVPAWIELKEMAVSLSKSELIPQNFKGKPADIWLVITMGNELKVPPLLALSQIAVIQGKPTLSADLMVGIARKSGACIYFKLIESTDSVATFETLRKDCDEPVRLSFTIEDAKNMGLTARDGWKKQPKVMLRKRCKAALCREVYEDVLAGMYAQEEIEAIQDTPPHAQNAGGISGLKNLLAESRVSDVE